MSNVPCNGCRACCRYEMIPLQDGDDPRMYEHRVITTPIGDLAVLKRQPNGDCIYLGVDGCTIHGRAPVVCRAFDCRAWYAMQTSAERRVLKRDPGSRDVVLAGKARLHTL